VRSVAVLEKVNAHTVGVLVAISARNVMVLGRLKMIVNPKRVVEMGWVTNLLNKEEQIQQNGVDLTLADIALIEGGCRVGKKHKSLPNYIPLKSQPTLEGERIYKLEPGKGYILRINEVTKIPKDKCAMVWMRSTFNRCGCPIFACVFDSGYKGNPTFAAYPVTPIHIEQGARVAQIVFFEADSASMYEGQYQHQGLEVKK